MAHTHKKEAAVCYAANQLAHRSDFGSESDSRNLLDDHVATYLGLDEGWLANADDRAIVRPALRRRPQCAVLVAARVRTPRRAQRRE